MDTNKLYVANISFKLDDEALKELFETCGKTTEVKILKDRETQKSRGFGFVTYERSEDASFAINTLNGKEVAGRALVVKEALETKK